MFADIALANKWFLASDFASGIIAITLLERHLATGFAHIDTFRLSATFLGRDTCWFITVFHMFVVVFTRVVGFSGCVFKHFAVSGFVSESGSVEHTIALDKSIGGCRALLAIINIGNDTATNFLATRIAFIVIAHWFEKTAFLAILES
jgi:hypothetical protein